MKTTLSGLAALLLLTAGASLGYADPYYYPFVRQAPDACGPGFYCTNYCGCVYGPNYYVRPPWEPFNGFRPCLQQDQQQAPGYGIHPFARSPRDFFMLGDP
jgi:hypothetical protein